MTSKKKNILIIKHGALGDFILSFGPFKAIRNYHLNDNLVLLTTGRFEKFAQESKQTVKKETKTSDKKVEGKKPEAKKPDDKKPAAKEQPKKK